MTRGAIAFIDDEPRLCEAASEWLTLSGFEVETYDDPAAALDRIDISRCECVVTDMRMPGITGMELLKRVRTADPDLPVVLLTGHADVPLAVEAMQAGAYDFIEKPYDADHLVVVLDRAVERRRLRREVARLRKSPDAHEIDERLVGISPAMVELRRTVLGLADVDVDILLHGETGTGKEVVARALHDFGPRKEHNFVAVNCAAMPESIFESEVFGHDKGAFTGAGAMRQGKLEYANGGTVFLDEIESMPLALQAKVLRAIQERSIERLGSNRAIRIDIRIIAASKLDLRAESAAGRFRPDLYFRLATVELAIPPLRERREDIPLLFALFARQAAERFGAVAREPDASHLAALQRSEWPGNVRELKSAAERSVLGIGAPPLPADEHAAAVDQGSLPERVARFEADAIAEALRRCGGSTSDAAAMLGLPRRTLNEKISRYGLRTAVH